MARITISLSDPEKFALRILAESEFRDPRAQAALIIRQELEKRGLLVIDSHTNPILVGTLPAEDPKSTEGETHVTD
jgi:hypothetical protein